MQMGFPYYTDHRTPFFSWPPSRWLFEEGKVTMVRELPARILKARFVNDAMNIFFGPIFFFLRHFINSVIFQDITYILRILRNLCYYWTPAILAKIFGIHLGGFKPFTVVRFKYKPGYKPIDLL